MWGKKQTRGWARVCVAPEEPDIKCLLFVDPDGGLFRSSDLKHAWSMVGGRFDLWSNSVVVCSTDGAPDSGLNRVFARFASPDTDHF